jgi:UDP-N-acetylmuramyl pentapeptide phosphotransferase/UDP-N-acetylglucosamine-1-phosphate transferase
MIVVTLLVSGLSTLGLLRVLIPRLAQAGIVGEGHEQARPASCGRDGRTWDCGRLWRGRADPHSPANILLAIIAAHLGEVTSLVLLLAALGALLATLYFNWYPARVFIGDVGTLTIGTVIATAVIVGNFELSGVIVIIPHAIDFVLKARKGFPSTGWHGEYRDGKLYCPAHGPVGLAQLILKLAGGMHERTLVLVLIGFEALCGLLAIWIYWRV